MPDQCSYGKKPRGQAFGTWGHQEIYHRYGQQRELQGLDDVKELYVTSDSDAAIICRLSGDMQRILSIQDRIDLTDVNNIRVIPIKTAFKKTTIPLASSNITITCAYCDKKVTEGAVRKKLEDKDYFFCCNTCMGAFEEKFNKLLSKSRT